MKKFIKVSISLGIILTCTALYVGVVYYNQNLVGPDDEYDYIVASAEWAVMYKNTQELIDAADLVVLGEVTSSTSFIEQVGLPHTVENTIISTNHTFKITKILKGSAEVKEILIQQTGGIIDKTVSYIQDDPLLTEDVEMIVFLREFESNGYCILGGPQGRFHIKNNKVYSIGELYPDSASTTKALHTDGVTKENFFKTVEDN